MPWPTISDYAKSIDFFYQQSVLDPQLIGGQPQHGNNGHLKLYPGNFSVTFPIEVSDFFLPKTFALRCWTRGNSHTYDSCYKKIEDSLAQVSLPYFVEFKYVHDGVFVNGETWPITRMEWSEGQTLRSFIQQNVDRDSSVFKKAACEFQNMVAALHEHQISHGDLQHGNILLTQNGDDIQIKLIDYDSLWVEGLGDTPQTTLGLPDYQHPARIKGGVVSNRKIDYFSELVIYLSLMGLSEKPELWNQFGEFGDGLLFSKADFKNPDDSKVFLELQSLSTDVRQLTHTLKVFCKETDVNQLAPLEDVLPKTGLDPRFHYDFAVDLQHSGETDQAIIVYQRAIYCDRSFKEAHYGLGLVYLEQTEYANATIPLYKAIALDPSFKEAHYSLGRTYLELGELQASVRMTEEALKFDANFQPARQFLEKIKDIYYDRGLTCLRAQAYNEAISEFQNALKINPDFKEGYHFLGSTYFELGDLQAAEKTVEQALQIEPTFQPAQALLRDIKYAYGTTCLNNEQYNEAVAAFEEAIDLALNSKDVHYYLGFAYFKLGHFQEAEDAAQEALWVDPTYQLAQTLLRDIKYAYYKQGTTYLDYELYDEAVAAFKKAIVLDPDFKEAYRELGFAYFGLGNFQAAVKAARKALKVDSEDQVTHNFLKQIKREYHKLGLFYLDNVKCRKAITAFKAAIALDKNFKEAHRALGLSYFKLGDLLSAEKAARDALNIDKTYTDVFWLLGAIKQKYYTRGLDSLKEERCNEAIHQFQRSIDIDPNFVEAHGNLGIAYFKLDKLEAAKKEANKALNLDSSYQPACKLLEDLKEKYRRRGVDYWKIGIYTKAAADYQRAIEIDPNFKEAHYNLGIACQNQKQYTKAVEAYQRAIEIDPNFKEAHYNLGIACRNLGECAEAVVAYQRVIEIDPDFRDAYYSLGLTYFKMEKFQDAKEAIEEVLRLDPNYQPAHKFSEKIEQISAPKDRKPTFS